jgi:hypothetical protein
MVKTMVFPQKPLASKYQTSCKIFIGLKKQELESGIRKPLASSLKRKI